MSVKIKDIVIGEGMPKICVPLMGQSQDEIAAAARLVLEKKHVDLVEWRADDFDDVFHHDALESVLKKIRSILCDVPLLVTFRSCHEGGKRQASDEEYLDFLQFVSKNDAVDMIDIELMSPVALQALQMAKKSGRIVVMSNHDFFNTPNEHVILERLTQMQSLGADIAKIAVMPKKMEDVLLLMDITLKANRLILCPVVTMSMGKMGLMSRLCGQQTGSAITFGTAFMASAPGQIDADVLYDVLKLFDEKRYE